MSDYILYRARKIQELLEKAEECNSAADGVTRIRNKAIVDGNNPLYIIFRGQEYTIPRADFLPWEYIMNHVVKEHDELLRKVESKMIKGGDTDDDED